MPLHAAESKLQVAEPNTPSLSKSQTNGAKGRARRLASTHKSKLPVIVWLILCLIWGSTWLFIKLGLEDLPPFTFAGIRFIIASTILFSLVAVRRLSFPSK